MLDKNIIFISIAINNDPNRTQYQRCFCLSQEFNTYIFLANNKIFFPPEIARLTKSVYRFPLTSIFRFLFPFWIIKKVLFKLRCNPRNTLIYVTYHSLSILTGALFKLFGFRTVVDIWDDPLLPVLQESKRHTKNRIKLLFNKILSALALRLLKTFDVVILALSQDFKQILREYSVEEGKIFHITNGVDIELIKSYPFPKNFQASDNFTVCYVGHVSWITGCDILVEAIIKLNQRYPDIRLELIGDYNPKEEGWLENKFKKLPQLKNVIKIRGYLPHEKVIDLVAKSSVCVFPFPKLRQYEYIYPIKIFEYMAMGKAIIASKLKGVQEILTENQNALFFEPGSVESLAEKILLLYENRELCKKLGQRATKDVQKYDWSKINKLIIDYLNNIF